MNEKPLGLLVQAYLHTDRECFSPETAMLLRGIERMRSLRAAARDMGLPYSRAWSLLRDAEEGLGFPLVHSSAGGSYGGGAVLTPKGLALVEAYEQLVRELNRTGGELFSQYFGKFL